MSEKKKWFRLHTEFAFDPKVQSMSETFQRRFIMLLCLKCNGDLADLSEEEISFALRISNDELKETKQAFISKRFIDEDWNIKNWDKRQYKSDSSTERVRKHREKQVKRRCNVSVTPPETETETETDKRKKNIYTSSGDEEPSQKEFYLTRKKKKLSGKKLRMFNEAWDVFNFKKGKAAAADAWREVQDLDGSFQAILAGAKKYAEHRAKIISQGLTPKWFEGWLRARRWEDEDIETGEIDSMEAWRQRKRAEDHRNAVA